MHPCRRGGLHRALGPAQASGDGLTRRLAPAPTGDPRPRYPTSHMICIDVPHRPRIAPVNPTNTTPIRPAALALALALSPAVMLSPALPLAPAAAHAQEVGPPNGSLIIAGGALRDPAVFAQFVELAGGPSAPIVIIPTAGGGRTTTSTSPAAVPSSARGRGTSPSSTPPTRRLPTPTPSSSPSAKPGASGSAAGASGGWPTPTWTRGPTTRSGTCLSGAASSEDRRRAPPSRGPTWCAATPAPTRS